MGYDGTALFHHAAYVASYTARLSNVAGDATSYIWHRPDKTAPGHDEQGTPGAGKGIQERDLHCLQRHNMDSTTFYTTLLDPPVGDPTAVYAPPLRYKREALAVHRTDHTDSSSRTSSLSWEGNTTHSGCRVLRSGGPNHSKSCCVSCVLEEDRSKTSYPLSTHPLG